MIIKPIPNFMNMQKMFLVISIGALAFLAILPGKTTSAQSVNDSMTIIRERTFGHRLNKDQIIWAKDNRGRNFKMVVENDVIAAFFVDEKKVPIENMMEYDGAIKKIDDQLKKNRERIAWMRQQSMRERSSRDSLKYIAGIVDRGDRYGEMNIPKWERDIYDSIMTAADSIRRRKLAEMQQQAISARYSKDSLSYIANIMERGKKYGEMQLTSKWERDIYDSVMSQADLEKADRREMQRVNIVNDLIGDAIIKDRANLYSFWLGASSFVVNGEDQSFEIYDRYKSKYIKTPGEVYSFNER